MRHLLLTFLGTLLLISCNDSSENQDDSETITQDTVQTLEDTLQIIKPVDYLYVTNEELAISHVDSLFKSYSIESRKDYPYDSLNTKPALIILRNHNPDTLQFYLTYFFLKRYRYDLKIGHISYELRNMYNPIKFYNTGIDTVVDPILYEFFRFYNPLEERGISLDSMMTKPVERIGSHIILDWLEEKPHYKSYPLISDELDSIRSVREWINTLEYP